MIVSEIYINENCCNVSINLVFLFIDGYGIEPKIPLHIRIKFVFEN